jgi:Uma2 family endonuclease
MKTITDISQLDFSKQYTYADYLKWRFEERVELIKGWLYKMSPAPKRMHQRISGQLYGLIWMYFRNDICQIFDAPFDVRLIKNRGVPNKEIKTVVQPDICIICDRSKLDDYGCIGAPDLIVEVLSESTAKRDYNEKFNLYEENEVKEYWIANPDLKTIEIYSLENGVYLLHGLFDAKEGADIIAGKLFPEMNVSLKEVFKD